jgi:chemotaxis protein histidine kinase CheA
LLFVNAHTVKGAARTLHFSSLADAIHLAEDHYAMILRGDPPQRDMLLTDARAALAELESYREINRTKLNRSDDLSKITIDRDLVLNHFQVVRQWLQHEQPTVDELMVFLRQHSEALTTLIFEQLPTIFDAYVERASKIARDLGKAEPQLHIDVPVMPVAAAARVVLDNCMIHILRNALDHGIETAEERKAQKKPPMGSIWIKGFVEYQELVLEVCDDGRGLALGRLREKAVKSGSLGAQSSDEDVASLIFMEGMSTSPSLTPISGRGIGMSAVRRFLEEAGGSIAIELKPDPAGSSNYRSFLFRMRLPLQELRKTSASEAA